MVCLAIPFPPQITWYISPRLGLIVSSSIGSVSLFSPHLCCWFFITDTSGQNGASLLTGKNHRETAPPNGAINPKDPTSHTQTYILISLQTWKLEIQPHLSRSNIFHSYGVKLKVHVHNEMQSSYCMFFLSKETVTDVEFPAFSDMFILGRGEHNKYKLYLWLKICRNFFIWTKSLSRRKRPALLLISVLYGGQKNRFQQRDHRTHMKCQSNTQWRHCVRDSKILWTSLCTA